MKGNEGESSEGGKGRLKEKTRIVGNMYVWLYAHTHMEISLFVCLFVLMTETTRGKTGKQQSKIQLSVFDGLDFRFFFFFFTFKILPLILYFFR